MNSIEAAGLGKAYKSYPRKSGRALEWLGFPPQHHLHWVLRDASFSVAPGESLGIIGMNGAGKSTLLKIIAGVISATTGSVHRAGRLAALLELGMGFHPEFTGRQNVYMAGQLQGLSAEQVREHMAEIEAFADIGEYIDEPVRTYSSGMQVRLAFSVATTVRPDILIVDEALAVGDIFFQQKCFERLAKFRRVGTTLLFVSHAMPTIIELCDRAIWLRDGRIEFDGAPREATDLYQASALVKLDKRPDDLQVVASADEGLARGSIRTDAVSLEAVRLLDSAGKETTLLTANDPATLELRYAVQRDLDDPHVGFKIRNRYGAVIFETNSYCMRQRLGAVEAGTTLRARFSFPAIVAPGEYTVSSGFANRGFAEGSFEEALSYRHEILAFSVARMSSDPLWMGMVNLSPRLHVEREATVANLRDVRLPGLPAFRMRTHASGDRYISREIAEHGVWEPLESRVFAQLVKPGSIVLDLGANIGYYTVLAGLCAGPRGQVYAFEPESHNVALLRENVALNDLGNVTVAEAAAWSVSNAGELYLSADNKGDHRAYDGGNGAGSVPVQRVALDDWFADRERRIDVVKMDTQGSELRILQGMRGLLDANRGRMRLIVEFWPHGLEGAGDSAAALVELLRGYDFTLSKVDETLTQAQPTDWDRLLEEARTIYHPSTRHYTNLLLVPRS